MATNLRDWGLKGEAQPKTHLLRLGEDVMEYKFDSFKRTVEGNTLWIATDESLQDAKERIRRLSRIAPGKYLIVSEKECAVVEQLDNSQDRSYAA
jgi:hypothetical protein